MIYNRDKKEKIHYVICSIFFVDTSYIYFQKVGISRGNLFVDGWSTIAKFC